MRMRAATSAARYWRLPIHTHRQLQARGLRGNEDERIARRPGDGDLPGLPDAAPIIRARETNR